MIEWTDTHTKLVGKLDCNRLQQATVHPLNITMTTIARNIFKGKCTHLHCQRRSSSTSSSSSSSIKIKIEWIKFISRYSYTLAFQDLFRKTRIQKKIRQQLRALFSILKIDNCFNGLNGSNQVRETKGNYLNSFKRRELRSFDLKASFLALNNERFFIFLKKTDF